MPDRIPVIDADAHIVERESDIRKYLAPPWDRRPGSLRVGDQPWDSSLFRTLGGENSDYEPVPGVRYVRGMSPAEQVDAWHRLMQREGLERVVCFPTGSGNMPKLREKEFQLACIRACNDHFAREYNALSDRVHCVGVLPVGYPDEAVKELRRAVKELGLISFQILTFGMHRAFGDPYYWPIYEEAERLGVPLCFHGQRAGADEVGAGQLSNFTEVHTYAFPVGMLLHFTSVIYQGVTVRFPNLKLAFLEIGATWLPYWLDRMDEHWEKRGAFETPLLNQKPSQIVREANVWFSLEAGETLLPQAIEYVGDQHFLYASDVPHWDNEFPESLHKVQGHPGLSRETKEKILYRNPKALFGL